MSTVRLGKNQKRALAFYASNPGWHSFNKRCRATVAAIQSLRNLGLVQVNEYGQASLAI